jgi:CRISPR/Cas system-associated exonuclease Cas4 (RecB family)
MTAPHLRTLSKSDFKVARTCDAKLWFRENGYPDNKQFDHYLKLLAMGGYMVEALAMASYPEGINLEYGGDVQKDFEKTMELLSHETVTLFQATLLLNRRLARVDIIEKKGNVIRLIEVKAKSFDSAAHNASLRENGNGEFRIGKRGDKVSSDWSEKLEDIAYQTVMLERLVPDVVVHPFLCMVDKSKRSALDNVPQLFRIVETKSADGSSRLHSAEFLGTKEDAARLDLLTEVDVSREVAILRDEVDAEASRFESMLDEDWNPAWAARGCKCKGCEYQHDDQSLKSGFAHCWGELAAVEPHILELYRIDLAKQRGMPMVESLLSENSASLLDVDEDSLCKANGEIGPVAFRQRRQLSQTRANKPWYSDRLRGMIEELQYPLHFIDFEVTRVALPYHSRMRPYGQVAFQWSCHTVNEPGAIPIHTEWLNTANAWPNSVFARSLRNAVGDSARLVTWSHFEGSTLREIDRELGAFDADDPEMTEWIASVRKDRILDMHAWAKDDFFHPGMRGRTSIKVVMDALWKSDARMRAQFTEWTGMEGTESVDPYNALPALEINGIRQNIHEGTGAMRGYEAMMYGVEDEATKQRWRELLLQYCKLDTLSMVLIFEQLRRATIASRVPSGATIG